MKKENKLCKYACGGEISRRRFKNRFPKTGYKISQRDKKKIRHTYLPREILSDVASLTKTTSY
jgi:hypothetical protein